MLPYTYKTDRQTVYTHTHTHTQVYTIIYIYILHTPIRVSTRGYVYRNAHTCIFFPIDAPTRAFPARLRLQNLPGLSSTPPLLQPFYRGASSNQRMEDVLSTNVKR